MSGPYPIKGIVTGLTPREKLYLITHPHHIGTIQDNANKALAEAQRQFSGGQHNGPADAFRHCYWSALLARDIGPDNAKTFTDAHEAYGDNPAGEKAMDLNNNGVGIAIGRANPGAADGILIGQCILAVTDGRLKLSP
jgi:hypothetical protein